VKEEKTACQVSKQDISEDELALFLRRTFLSISLRHSIELLRNFFLPVVTQISFNLLLVLRNISLCTYLILIGFPTFIFRHTTDVWSRDSSVGIPIRYGLEGPGIESRWGEIFRTYPDRVWGQTSRLCNGYRVFPGGKGDRGMMLTTHPLLMPRLRKN
jgi:hypothetical protein